MLRALVTLTAALSLSVPLAPARADGSCDTPQAVDESLCRAARPLPLVWMSVTSPKAGKPVDLVAGSDGRGLTFAWDLDGDGVFDDATGDTVSGHRFAAGYRGVGVRVTDQFGRTGIETRSFLVHTVNVAPKVEVDIGTGRVDAGRPLTVTAEGSDYDGAVAKLELDLDDDGVYEVASTGAELSRAVTFASAGGHVVRARVTDDDGQTARATATVSVAGPKGVIVGVRPKESPGDPILAGEPAVVTAAPSGFARYEFDLDGDGTYERDRGADDAPFDATFGAGDHLIGVRATDAAGQTFTSRATFHAHTTFDGTDPRLVMEHPALAYTGVPVRLQARAYPNYRPYTFAWDADGDGAFDDGTAAGDGPASKGSVSFTYTAPGTYEVRAKVTTSAGVSRIAMRTITVSAPPAVPPAFTALRFSGLLSPERSTAFEVEADEDVDLAFDLDGDGAFDDGAEPKYYGYEHTFTQPATVSVKATAPDGGVAVRSADVSPIAGNLGPQADLYPYRSDAAEDSGLLLAGHWVGVDYDVYADDLDFCCSLEWDVDGDGTYEPGYGRAEFLPAAGTRTIGLRAIDGHGAVGTVRDTFGIGTRPPQVRFGGTPAGLRASATDPDGDAIAALAWDLDGDRDFDDATGATAVPPAGASEVGVMATDAGGDIGIFYGPVSSVLGPTPGPVIEPVWVRVPAPAPSAPVQVKSSVTKVNLRTLRSRGLPVRVDCTRACHSTVVAIVDAATAKRLGLGAKRQVGRGAGRGPAITVKLDAKARKALAKARSVTLRLRFRTTIAGPGRPIVSTTRVRISR
jgi:hypothetical protein